MRVESVCEKLGGSQIVFCDLSEMFREDHDGELTQGELSGVV